MNTQAQYLQSKNNNQYIAGDIIENLPSDYSVPSHNELRLVDSLFQKQQNTIEKIVHNSKDVIIIGLLFFIFSLPQIDGLIKKIVPITTSSSYILLGVKTLLFMFVYFLLNNFYLSKCK